MKKDFITVNQTSGKGNGQVEIEADLNNTFQERSTVLNVDTPTVHQEIRVTQDGGFPFYPIFSFIGMNLTTFRSNKSFINSDGILENQFGWYTENGTMGSLQLDLVVPINKDPKSFEVIRKYGTLQENFNYGGYYSISGSNSLKILRYGTRVIKYNEQFTDATWYIYMDGEPFFAISFL